MPVFTKSSRLSPHHRLVIALHSLSALPETGLRMCHPEKGRQIDAIRPRVVRSLQSALRTKYHEIRACFAYFAEKGGAVSLQFRLAGGGRGIRTPGTLSGTAVFKTARFNHSRIPPRRALNKFQTRWRDLLHSLLNDWFFASLNIYPIPKRV